MVRPEYHQIALRAHSFHQKSPMRACGSGLPGHAFKWSSMRAAATARCRTPITTIEARPGPAYVLPPCAAVSAPIVRRARAQLPARACPTAMPPELVVRATRSLGSRLFALPLGGWVPWGPSPQLSVAGARSLAEISAARPSRRCACSNDAQNLERNLVGAEQTSLG